jgi:hypothetical protein
MNPVPAILGSRASPVKSCVNVHSSPHRWKKLCWVRTYVLSVEANT